MASFTTPFALKPNFKPSFFSTNELNLSQNNNSISFYKNHCLQRVDRKMVISATATVSEPANKRYPGENKGFVEEMRFVAMKLHTKDQAREGEKERQAVPMSKWEPTVDGYMKFLVDSKAVYDVLERIVEEAAIPQCTYN